MDTPFPKLPGYTVSPPVRESMAAGPSPVRPRPAI